MKRKVANELFLKTCKDLQVTEQTLILLAAFYNSGKWRAWVDMELVEDMILDWEKEDSLDDMVVNFCLDIESGRLPPNWMINKFEQMKRKHPRKS